VTFYLFAIIVSAAVSTIFFSLIVERFSFKKGLVAEDAHKRRERLVPTIGGLGYIAGLVVGFLVGYVALSREGYSLDNKLAVVFLLVVASSGMIGLIDDLRKLGGKTKVALTLIPGIIVVLSGAYEPRLYIPFIGEVQASIVFPLVIPVAFAIAMNAVNMIDTHNGLAPLSVTVLLLTILAALVNGNTVFDEGWTVRFLASLALASMVGYLPFNLYPSRVFNGDVGSLTWGALLVFLAIIGKVEALLVMAAMPVITNGFSILYSIRGFVEHSQLRERPTRADKVSNTIMVNTSRNAPITLVSLALSYIPLKEDELVCSIVTLLMLTSVISLIVWFLSLG